MTIRVAVVGLGNIGRRHAQIYRDHPAAELVGVCDIIPERAKRAAEDFGAPAYLSVSELLEGAGHLDAVSVASAGEENGGDHFVPTMELLGAGIPVLGEKPISNRIGEARQMVAEARRAGLCYGVDLNHRFTPACQRIGEWIRDGRLGELNMVSMRMWINNPNESSPWYHLRALHPHSIDILRFVAGDVESVAAFAKKGKGREIWSNVMVLIKFRSGVVGTLTGSYDAGPSWGLEQLDVAGSDGRAVLEDACEALTWYPRKGIETETYRYLGGMRSFTETFASRIGRWVEQIDAHAGPEEIDGSGADGLIAQKVIEAAITSIQEGGVVLLDPAV